jgi:hypothetical protein
MKSLKLNLMGVEADTIKNISIDNDIDGETGVIEKIEVSTKSGDNFEFKTDFDGSELSLTIKGPNGPMMVLEQGPEIKRVRTISGVSSVKGTDDEFVAMTDFGELHISMFDGLQSSLKAEKTKELEFRVWADNPHE